MVAVEIIQIDNFSFSYSVVGNAQDRFGHCVLDGVSFVVEEGAFCVITGQTGCGKTTLLRSCKPELMPVGEMGGSLRVCGVSLIEDGAVVRGPRALSQKESAELIGYVMQDPDMQIVCDTVWHELAFGLENLGMSQDEMRRRVAEVAHFFGMEPWIHAATEDLSGGQKQQVNLAAALALRPRVLLLDEPTAQLDPNAVKQFLFLLGRVNRELGITVVVATHSPEDMEPYATQHVRLGESGVCALRDQMEERLAPRRNQRAALLERAGCCLSVREAYFRYDRMAPWVLRGVDVRIAEGSVHAFVGGNGCGKTTLLRLLAGVEKPQRGRIDNQLAKEQALLPQDPKALFVADTVREELEEWRSRCGYGDDGVAAMLDRFELAGCENQHPYDLSGGQQQKLALAKLLLCRPRLLFLDEPTKGLDPQACADAMRIVHSLADEGCTVVLVTHDLDFALAAADSVSMLFDGELACTESAQDFFRGNLVYRPNACSRLFGAMVYGE